jgi:membrane-bound lytic murein transglycosylase D
MEEQLPMTMTLTHAAAAAALWLVCSTALAQTEPATIPTTPAVAATASSDSAAPAASAAAGRAVTATSPASAAAPAQAASAAAPDAPMDLPADLVPLDAPPPPPMPRGRLDTLNDDARASLWDRVRGNFVLRDLSGDLVRKWEQFYAKDPAYVGRMTERSSRYLFHIVEEVQRRNMPIELALLPFIESAFNPQAMSVARASGMWQFMPATGKDFSLRQNLFRDDRRDVLASTRAALDYLQKLNTLFGDWHLALAAYNWGQGNVLRAQAINRNAGLPVDYESLRMPLETREYVPKLQAVKNIVQRPEAYALSLPELGNHPHFLSVAIERDIDVALAAKLANLPLEDFQQLNPQMNKPVILAAGTPQVLLPYDNANLFMQQLPRHRGPLASWTAWVAPKTLKPVEAARMTGMNEEQLREVNRIPPRMLVKVGSTLLVPRGLGTTRDVTEKVADAASISLSPEAPPLRRVAFKVGKRGDSVAAVAKRYRVSTGQVAQWNKVAPDARFKAGQAVVVMVKAGPPRAVKSAGRSAGKPVAKAAGRKLAKAGAAPKRSKVVAKAASQPRGKASKAPRAGRA